MKRVLVAIDANQVNVQVLDFACYIAKLTHSKLTGVFLSAQTHEPVEVFSNETSAGLDEKNKLLKESITLFRDACSNRGTNCSICNEITIPPAELINETRFAELLIVDPDMSFKDKKEEVPSAFIKNLLAQSECPVVLAPFNFYGIDEILFAYDGSAGSVYAIKQFTYLFPQFTGKKITVLQVDENGDGLFVNKEPIGELLQLHYDSIGYQLLKGKASDELFVHLLGKKNIFVVMGAFGRGMISGLIKHSTAELIIKTFNLPVFIAHHK